MDTESLETHLTQGLDCSPSPPFSRHRTDDISNPSSSVGGGELSQPIASSLSKKKRPNVDQVESISLRNSRLSENDSSLSRSTLIAVEKFSAKQIQTDKETFKIPLAIGKGSIHQNSLQRHSLSGIATSRFKASVESSKSTDEPMLSKFWNRHSVENHSESFSSAQRDEFFVDRSRLSLPPFKSSTVHRKVVESGSKSELSFKQRSINPLPNMTRQSCGDTFQHHSELPSRLVPAACSSALHDSVNKSANQSASSHYSVRSILERRSQSLLRTPQGEPPLSSNSLRPPCRSPALSNLSATNTSVFSGNRKRASNELDISKGNISSLGSKNQSSKPVNVRNNPAEMEGDSGICKTIISVIWQRGTLGACIYNTDVMKLQLIQDIPEGGYFLSTSLLYMQTQPEIVITGGKKDCRFLQSIKDMIAADEDNQRICKLHTLPNDELGYEVCRRRLLLACENSLAHGRTDKESFVNSTINTTNYVNMVRAAGGLLQFLENSVNLLVNNGDDELPVLSVELYFMESHVWMDASTFRDMFLRPSRDLQLLDERLDCLEYFSPGKNTEVTQLIKSNLSKLRNMTRIVAKMRNAELTSADWLTMLRVLQSLIIITEICTQHKGDLAIFSKFPAYRESIQSSGQILFDILDVEQTKLSKTFTIKPNYDAEMDTLVQRHRDLPELLAERLTTHVREIKQIVRSAVHIHYSSQLGCLLMIDITPRMERSGDYSVENLKLEFLTDNNAYYSSDLTRDISDAHGDVKTAITDRALALMYQLQNTLLPEMDSMLQVLDLSSQLDCLIGLSSYCSEHSYVRPSLNTSDTMNIKSARHPLLEAQVDHFIGNDVMSGPGQDKSRVMVITGPNACGKSIYLKQTVLIVYLAHIGCLVPAESADICLTDAIFTHFSTTDSINSDVSTFTADLSKMAAIVTNATSKSLVVLDEFGKGTCPVDGAALLLSFLKHWLESGSSACPHVLVSSHFHIICKSSWIKESPLASLKTMETHVENGKLVYLYELVDGAAESSHAAAIAKLLEIPQDCMVHGAQATDQFALARQMTKNNNDHALGWKRGVVERIAVLDLDDTERVSAFLDSVLEEQ